MDSLFTTESVAPENKRRKMWWIVGVLAAVVVIGAAFDIWWTYRITDDDIRETILSYAERASFNDPDYFGGKAIREQMFAGAVNLDVKDNTVFAVILRKDKPLNEVKAKLSQSLRPGAKIEGSDDQFVFELRFPVKDLRTDLKLSVKYPTATFEIPAYEMARFMLNRNLYNGYKNIVRKSSRMEYTQTNFATRVAKPGEPALKAFAEALLKASGDKRAPELMAAVLLHFVNDEIEYAPEQNIGIQVVMRPNEVLAEGRANCAGKVVLLASLFEQVGLNYRIAYLSDPLGGPGHLTVLIPMGRFPVETSKEDPYPLMYEWDGAKWLVAETTSTDFLVGVSRLENWNFSFSFIQKPSEPNRIWQVRASQWVELGQDLDP